LRQALRGKDASRINLPVDLARPTALKPLLQLLTCGDAKVQVPAQRRASLAVEPISKATTSDSAEVGGCAASVLNADIEQVFVHHCCEGRSLDVESCSSAT